MKKLLTPLILIVSFIVLCSSCSKDNENIPNEIVTDYRLVSQVYDDGFMRNYYYNEHGFIRKVSDSDGNLSEYFYNEDNELVEVTSGSSYFVKIFYESGLLSYNVSTFYDYFDSLHTDTVMYEYNGKNLISKVVYGPGNYTQLTYNDQNRLVTLNRISPTLLSPQYDSTLYMWSPEGNLLEKRKVFKSWYKVGPDSGYFIQLDQENYEYDSFINPESTIRLPDAANKSFKMIGNDLDESVSKNNVVEIKTKYKREYDNTPHNNNYSTITRLFNVTESENNLPTRIIGEYTAWDLIYEKIE